MGAMFTVMQTPYEGTLDINLIENLLDILTHYRHVRSVCLCGGGWGCGRGLRVQTHPLSEKLFQMHAVFTRTYV